MNSITKRRLRVALAKAALIPIMATAMMALSAPSRAQTSSKGSVNSGVPRKAMRSI